MQCKPRSKALELPFLFHFQAAENNLPAKITRTERLPCKTELPAGIWDRYARLSPRSPERYCYIGLVPPEADPILSAFHDTGAYLRGHFRLTSGLHSPSEASAEFT